ncbi:unnamed protein product [Paramecium primaurelia]|uniref:RING-type domain-containing protein n=1 Tax=Paramecium primaurelia TaxID=5886 RepID=A0A8S1K2I7_PARPR|nr:unnamed protein product [Paramecium primaurelia]
MNQQQIILQNLSEIIRNNKIDLIIKYIEVIVYSITICFIQKDIKLHTFYQSSLIVFIQGIALTHYYQHIIYQYKKQIQNDVYNWSAPFDNLQTYHSDQLKNTIILYHSNFMMVKIANLIFEIVLFISTPYEIYRYLKTPLNSYSNLILFEITLYFVRRVQLLLIPFLGFFKFVFLLLFRRQRRQNLPIFQNQTQTIENIAIQLHEQACSEIELECIICLQKISNKYVKLQCDHYFHKECIDNWIKQKQICPLCRSSIN